MLEIQISEMDELQAINDANIEALKTTHEKELDAVEEELALLRKAEAKHAAELQKVHEEHQEVQERHSAQIAELTSALARSRINGEDGCMSSPSKRARLHGPDEGQKAVAGTPPTVRRRITSKKRIVGPDVDQRISRAGPLAAKSQFSPTSTPSKETTNRRDELSSELFA